MRVLFVHQRFPAQFKFLAPALQAQGHAVAVLTMQPRPADTRFDWHHYRPTRGSTPAVHPWLVDFETKVIRAEACYQAAHQLRQAGYAPDLILAHPGWGESLFLKTIWPQARLSIYCEFYYQATGADSGFDPEFAEDPLDTACRLRLKNLNNLLHFETADAGLSPTHWQASTFPESFRPRIQVVHDGIDTATLRPNAAVGLSLSTASGARLTLTRNDEIITFVNRNLEPYRGYHIFMRALPALLRRRPNARVLIVGGDDVSYGLRPDGGRKWKDIFAAEVRPQIPDGDWSRVHFLGNLPYPQFIGLLQLSTVHVYLTYPFVLSWSLLEAMSVGCAIVGSDTAPVREVIEHDVTGRLVDFFDVEALTEQICELLADPVARARLGLAARAQAQARYDLQRICLPEQLRLVESWVG